MSDFEFLRNMPIGQYLPLDSPIHRLDARARLLGFLSLILAVTFAPHAAGIFLGLALALLLLLLAKIPLAYALRGLLPPLPFLVIIALLQVFFNAIPDRQVFFQWWRITLSVSDLIAGGLLLLRFCGLVLVISLSSFCLSTSELTRALESFARPFSKIGLPAHDLVLTVQVTLRFIPFLAQAAERIAKAQASRGADWGSNKGGLLAGVRRVAPVIVPLFLTSLRRAENLALAMDARGYGVLPQRSSMTVLTFRWQDGLALFCMVAASACMVFLI